ncbi:MAG: HD domain-containing protein [Bacilli bacterium]|nr:HD domain-containing protein [Bacilli bacterium]
MKLSDRALTFAIKAHEGASRKDETDKPFIIHPMITGEILKSAGFDDAVIAAGYLHDISEDTTYTIDDLSKLFGGDVASLVMTSCNHNTNLSWKEKKTQKIKLSKELPSRNKAVILADKISNLEDIKYYSIKLGKINFDNYGGDFEDQKWYYESMYDSLTHNVVDPLLFPLFDRFFDNITEVFYTDISKLSSNKSNNNEKNKAQINELIALKSIINSSKPFIIEFNNNKKSNSELIDICNNFFNENNFKIKVVSFSNVLVDDNALNLQDRNTLILAELELNFLTQISEGQDIIIVDGSLFNKLILMQRLLKGYKITNEEFKIYLKYFKENINYVLVNFRNKNKEISIEAISNYIDLLDIYNIKLNNYDKISNQNYKIFDALLPIMRKEYIKELKLYLETKKR